MTQYIKDNGFQVLDINGKPANSVNLTSQESPYRTFRPGVALTSKDNSGKAEYWSASTYSRALIINFAVDKKYIAERTKDVATRDRFFKYLCYDFGSNIDYVYLDEPSLKTVGWYSCNKDVKEDPKQSPNYNFWTPVTYYNTSNLTLPADLQGERSEILYFPKGDPKYLEKLYWVPIGSVSSVWKAPKITAAQCQELTVKAFGYNEQTQQLESKETAINSLNSAYTYQLQFAGTKTDKNKISQVDITITPKTGEKTHGKVTAVGKGCPAIADDKITSTRADADCKYFYKPKAGDRVSVSAVPTDNVKACSKIFTIPEAPTEQKVCQELGLVIKDASGKDVTLDATKPGQKYSLSFKPTYSDGSKIDQVKISLTTTGTSTGELSSTDSKCNLSANPKLKTGTVSAACQYSYTPAEKDTLKVEAVPTTGPGSLVTESKCYIYDKASSSTKTPTECTTDPKITSDQTCVDQGGSINKVYTSINGGQGTLSYSRCLISSKLPTDCIISKTYTPTPSNPICKELNLTDASGTRISNNSTFGQGQEVLLQHSIWDTGSQEMTASKIRYQELGGQGNGKFEFVRATGRGASSQQCPTTTSADFTAPYYCLYKYITPTDNTTATVVVSAVPDDGVPACSVSFKVTAPPSRSEYCQDINFQLNGQYGNKFDNLSSGNHLVSVKPVTNLNRFIPFVQWRKSGGTFSPSYYNDFYFPGYCPQDPTSVTGGIVPSVCKYYFNPGNNGSFNVDAVLPPGIGQSPHNSCHAEGNRGNTPPPPPPALFCLYLDVDYEPQPFDGKTANLDATVVMSDGSRYNDKVSFVSSNGSGNFNNSSSRLQTNVDQRNNVSNIQFKNGDGKTNLNIFLSNTSVLQSAACQRILRPVPTTPQEEVCETPPNIVKKENQFCDDNYGVNQAASEICWSVNGDATFFGNRRSATGRCVTLEGAQKEFQLTAASCDIREKNYCYDEYEEKEEIPSLEKRVSKGDSSTTRWSTSISYSTNSNNTQEFPVKYKLDYIPANFRNGDSSYMNVVIKDEIFNREGKFTTVYDSTGKVATPTGKLILNPESISVKDFQQTEYVQNCSARTLGQKAYCLKQNNNTITLFGINSNDKITIEYQAKFITILNLQDCQDGEYCKESVDNTGKVISTEYCDETVSDGTTITTCERDNDQPTPESNKTTADIVCAYFLTRASGDVFLEDDLEYGIDISKCYPYKNVTSLITKERPVNANLASTGSAQVVNINNEICKGGQNNFENLSASDAAKSELNKLYGSEIAKNLSSQICEVAILPGLQWTKAGIKAAIEKNVDKLVRWETTLVNSRINDISNPITYFQGDNNNNKLIITSDSDITISGDQAKTIIVRDADLVINSNIKYAENAPNASLGVIVIDGNIYIDKSVTELAGAYFVQGGTDPELDFDENKSRFSTGNIISSKNKVGTEQGDNEVADLPLTINGSLYGNVGPLFSKRVGAGDVSQDEGAVTIRYDQRMIQNPPPGFSELFGELSQSQTAK